MSLKRSRTCFDLLHFDQSSSSCTAEIERNASFGSLTAQSTLAQSPSTSPAEKAVKKPCHRSNLSLDELKLSGGGGSLAFQLGTLPPCFDSRANLTHSVSPTLSSVDSVTSSLKSEICRGLDLAKQDAPKSKFRRSSSHLPMPSADYGLVSHEDLVNFSLPIGKVGRAGPEICNDTEENEGAVISAGSSIISSRSISWEELYELEGSGDRGVPLICSRVSDEDEDSSLSKPNSTFAINFDGSTTTEPSHVTPIASPQMPSEHIQFAAIGASKRR
ncbi:hypothetical protein TrST_g2346 [Triparma strigata]|uniref:Uncharacterized protein n=1 Tax=Triparma strigata TaxID=1606541 RepID=A0A9W6ZNP4_9STRA|nr:hypothetical protein TrST_g2346 [Triparma strigata]